MKKGSMALAMAAAVFGACGCSAEEADTVKAEAEPGKILVAYYSYSGNTRFAAEQIQKATGGMTVVKTILVKNKLINLIVKPAK